MWGPVLGIASILYVMYRLAQSSPGSGGKSAPVERGMASFYAASYEGKPTSSGEPYRANLFTAAHKRLRNGTIVEVTRTDTGASVQVRINDNGPFVEGRIIDLSRAAAEALDMVAAGVVPVELRIVAPPK